MALPIPDYVPEGGWTQANFRGNRGRLLLRAWMQNRRILERRAIKDMRTDLRAAFTTLEKSLFSDMAQYHLRTSGKMSGQKVVIDVEGDERAWVRAIQANLEKFNIDITVRVAGTYSRTASTGYEAVSVQLGHSPTKQELDRISKDGLRLAQRVTGITQTTRDRLEAELFKAREDGLTLPETVKYLREKFPQIAYNRIPTIARTEMGRLLDHATVKALKGSSMVSEVSVVGCEAIEPDSPTYKGIPTCNIQGVPVEDADKLEFHINHTGAIIASKFREAPRGQAPPDHEPPEEEQEVDIAEATGTAQPTSAFPQALHGMEFVRKLGGTTGAELVRDPNTGNLFVKKSGASPGHIKEEMLADTIYRDQGIDVPEFQDYLDEDGNPVKLARFVEGDLLSELSGARREAAINKLREDFAFDAFLGSWDVAGTDLDNIIVGRDGRVWRIDNGGALRYRAMGGLKPEGSWGAFSEELWSMREPPNVGAKVFGGMDWDKIEESIKKIDFQKALDSIPDSSPFKAMLAEKALQYRRTERMAQRYRVADYRSSYRDKALRFGMQMRANGLSGVVAPGLEPPTPGKAGPEFVDSKGRRYGGWRGEINGKPAAQGLGASAPGDIFHDAESAVATMSYNMQWGHPWAYNKGTVDSFLDSYDHAPPEVKTHYKGVYDSVKKAKDAVAGAGDLVPSFSVFTSLQVERMPFAVVEDGIKAGATTPFEAYQAAARAHFGAKSKAAAKVVSGWQGSQGGSSWSGEAMAHSYFQLERATTLGRKSAYMKYPYDNPDRGKRNWEDYIERQSKGGLSEGDVEDAFAFHHQYVQEMLEHQDFPGNDWERGVIHLRRSVPIKELAGLDPDKDKGKFAKGTSRGPNVSMSGGRAVTTGNSCYTTQAVPHARVTGSYWLPPSWEKEGGDAFAGDHESEFTVLAPGIDFKYHGNDSDARREIDAAYFGGKIGDDASKWGVPLGHLKKLFIAVLQFLQNAPDRKVGYIIP